MSPVAIETADDPRIAAYGAIRERDLTGRGECFIIEGKVTLEVALRRGRFPLESLFIARHRLPALAGLLEAVPTETPIYTAERRLFDAVAGFPVHRGVLACARKVPPPSLNSLASAPRLVAGFGIANHDNVGALFRNAAAFGADGVVLDAQCCDPLYRKAIRVSAGTALWLPFRHAGAGPELLDGLKAAGHSVWALTPHAEAPSIWQMDAPERLTLLVGAEGPGLSDDILAAAQPVHIPIVEGVDSLNLATSAAIALASIHARGSPGAG